MDDSKDQSPSAADVDLEDDSPDFGDTTHMIVGQVVSCNLRRRPAGLSMRSSPERRARFARWVW